MKRVPGPIVLGVSVGLAYVAILTGWLIAEGASVWAIALVVFGITPMLVVASYVSWKLTINYIRGRSKRE